MRTVKQAALLFAGGAVLLAQQQNVIFTTAAPAGMPGLAGAQTFAFVSGELVGGNPVKGAPYSGNAVTDTTQTLADGNRIVNHMSAVVYRDGEGRERREQSIPNIGPFAAQGAPPVTIFISDPVAGVNYSLNPSNKTAIKLPVTRLVFCQLFRRRARRTYAADAPCLRERWARHDAAFRRSRRNRDRLDGGAAGSATGHDLQQIRYGAGD